MSHFIEKKISEDFDRARFKSFFKALFSFFKKDENELLSFEKVRKAIRPVNQIYKGVRSIPLENIRGSEGRYRDFDKEFLPKEENMRHRWEHIDKAHYANKELPPIQVYQIGELYFVKDGNHRVSVAKEKGQKYIDAEIIELKSKVPLEKDMDYEKLILKEEYVRFIEETNIDVLLPGIKFEFSIPGRYDMILEQIYIHQKTLSTLAGREISLEQTIKSWYKSIYLPVKKIIKKYHIMRHFPDLTQADLFLWIIRHWNNLRERTVDNIDTEYAAIDFKETYSRRIFYRLGKFFLKLLKINKIILMVLVLIDLLYANTNLQVKEPLPPKEPKITIETIKSNEQNKIFGRKNVSSEKNLYVFPVSIFFENKVSLKGIISLPEDSLRIQHTKSNFVFRKTIKWENVKSLQILEWLPSLQTSVQEAKVLTYYFYPKKYKILMQSNEIYYYDQNIEYFNKLILTNEEGSTDIYSFFIDYWNVTGEKTGYWKNARSTYFYAPFKQANRQVMKIINFQ